MDVSGWFRAERAGPAVTRIFEPHVHPLLRGNAWHVCGSERDLFVDAGLGLIPLRTALPELFDRDPILVVTHAHLDHAGGAHEFGDVVVHPAEAGLVEQPPRASLFSADLREELGLLDSHLPELLIDAFPFEGFDPGSYAVQPASVTRTVQDRDRIDLGDRQFSVLHLPGHSPGSIGLLDTDTGALFCGDTLYDGRLLDDLKGSDREDYVATMRRLLSTAFDIVYPGHGSPLSSAHARRLATAYIHARSPSLDALPG